MKQYPTRRSTYRRTRSLINALCHTYHTTPTPCDTVTL